jgi:hypothetical protein
VEPNKPPVTTPAGTAAEPNKPPAKPPTVVEPNKPPVTTPAGTAAEPNKPSVKPPTVAEPNKPGLDFDNPANQGFAPSIYMGVIENAAPVYHFVSIKNKRHFCTIKEDEKYKMLDTQKDTWKYQGIAFFAYPEGHQPEGARPVYRFWAETLGQHFYTMDEATRAVMKTKSDTWKDEGIAWYAPPAKPAPKK